MEKQVKNTIPRDHPRYQSLKLRERINQAYKNGILAESGMIAHGRGEAFDYLIGEKTSSTAKKAIKTASAALLMADNPVISVNGNTAALVPQEVVGLARLIPAKIEINLFYRTPDRVRRIGEVLKDAGAKRVLGTEDDQTSRLKFLEGPRSRCSTQGIYSADTVLVPLEDGDRTEALIKENKEVITIDLNPLSRTAQQASITIVDNIIRAIPLLQDQIIRLKNKKPSQLRRIRRDFNNQKNLQESLKVICKTLKVE